jgi:phenylpropionate dioxygenase-like ring-hydroxylating dioxygenase large terminal subunit
MEVSEKGVTEIVKDVPTGLDNGLANYWYPVLQSEELTAQLPLAFRIMSRDLVAWRDGDGLPRVVVDRCPHRNARLSNGHVLEGGLQCPFHGIRFNGAGRCVRIPWEPDDSPLVKDVAVAAYQTALTR